MAESEKALRILLRTLFILIVLHSFAINFREGIKATWRYFTVQPKGTSTMSRPEDSRRNNEKASFGLSNSILSNKIIFIVVIIVVFALILDALLTRTSDLLSPTLARKSATTIAVYLLISIAYFVGQFMIILFVRERSKETHASANLRFYRTYKIAMTVQIVLSILLLFVILQVVTLSYYSIAPLLAAVTISYGLAIAMMALLMKSFLSWFRSSKNLVILAYGISAATLAIYFGFTLVFAATMLLDRPQEVRTAVTRTAFFMPGSISSMLNDINLLTSILSFCTLWTATVLLLRHYSQKVGRIRYWIVVSLPLVYFLSQFPTFFLNLFSPIIRENPILFGSLLTLIFSLSKPAGGILFGIAFWTISKHLRRTVAVRDYLLIAAMGFVLLFTSDQAIVLISVSYPPFGVSAASLMGLSSYLIFVGIYYSAVSLSHDDRVRREIKKFAMQESGLLDSIGTAQVEKDIAEKITAIRRIQEDSAAQNLGVQPSIDEGDIRKYIEDVVNEIKLSKKEGKGKD
jgi:hypothetical protein